MNRWIVKALVAAAVVGAWALGAGMHANAKTPSPGPFTCGTARAPVSNLQDAVNRVCDPTKTISITYVPDPVMDMMGWCCVAK